MTDSPDAARAEALARIDADLARRVEAYLDSSVTAPTSRALITDLLAALIPEPPTEEEREALVRDLLDEANHYTTPKPVADLHRRAVEAIRHRGPITDEVVEAAHRAWLDANRLPERYEHYLAKMRAALEAAEAAR